MGSREWEPQAADLEDPPHLLGVGRTSRVCSPRPLGHGGLSIAWNCPRALGRARASGVGGVQESGGQGGGSPGVSGLGDVDEGTRPGDLGWLEPRAKPYISPCSATGSTAAHTRCCTNVCLSVN